MKRQKKAPSNVEVSLGFIPELGDKNRTVFSLKGVEAFVKLESSWLSKSPPDSNKPPSEESHQLTADIDAGPPAPQCIILKVPATMRSRDLQSIFETIRAKISLSASMLEPNQALKPDPNPRTRTISDEALQERLGEIFKKADKASPNSRQQMIHNVFDPDAIEVVLRKKSLHDFLHERRIKTSAAHHPKHHKRRREIDEEAIAWLFQQFDTYRNSRSYETRAKLVGYVKADYNEERLENYWPRLSKGRIDKLLRQKR